MNAKDEFPSVPHGTHIDGTVMTHIITTVRYEAMCERIDTLTAEVGRLKDAARPTLMPSAHELMTNEIDRLQAELDALRAGRVPTPEHTEPDDDEVTCYHHPDCSCNPEHTEVGLDWCVTHQKARAPFSGIDCAVFSDVQGQCVIRPLSYLSVPSQAESEQR